MYLYEMSQDYIAKHMSFLSDVGNKDLCVLQTHLILTLGNDRASRAPADQKASVHFFLGLQPNICRCLHASGSVCIFKKIINVIQTEII